MVLLFKLIYSFFFKIIKVFIKFNYIFIYITIKKNSNLFVLSLNLIFLICILNVIQKNLHVFYDIKFFIKNKRNF